MTETNHIAELITILHDHGYEVMSLDAAVSDGGTICINDASVRPSEEEQDTITIHSGGAITPPDRSVSLSANIRPDMDNKRELAEELRDEMRGQR